MPEPVLQLSPDGDPKGGLVDQAIADVRQFIRDQSLQAGEPLPSETALAQRLGVSRAVLREAFRALATLGILEIGNGRRARVAEPDASALSMIIDHTIYTRQLSIQQVLDVRRTLELRTVALAALRRTDAEAQLLQRLVAAMFDSIDTPNRVMDLDIRFHEAIARASGNSLYAIIIGSFRVITSQTWHIGWRSRATLENRIENLHCHSRIATAIAEQDADRATAAMDEHFNSNVAVLLRAGIT